MGKLKTTDIYTFHTTGRGIGIGFFSTVNRAFQKIVAKMKDLRNTQKLK